MLAFTANIKRLPLCLICGNELSNQQEVQVRKALCRETCAVCGKTPHCVRKKKAVEELKLPEKTCPFTTG